jgi:hypothetical protein
LAGIENGGNSALKLINRSIYIGLRSAFIVFYRRVQLAVEREREGERERERERERENLIIIKTNHGLGI